jgi:hypothetical protein
MDSNHGGDTNQMIASMGGAAAATAVSFIPWLTDIVRLITAVIGLLCAIYGAYRLFRSK